jgi:hypothetical protein
MGFRDRELVLMRFMLMLLLEETVDRIETLNQGRVLANQRTGNGITGEGIHRLEMKLNPT